MKLEKASLLLDKINALLKSIKIDPQQVATIEKDLMRSYIRQLYETFLDTELSASPGATDPPESIEIYKPREKKDKDPETGNSPLPKKVTNQLPEKKETEQIHYPEPKIIDIPPSIQEEMKEESPRTEDEPSSDKDNVQSTTKAATAVPQEMEALFEFAEARELSEKLGQSPIEDLSRAISLNERIFTINELFGGDKEKFTETISHLNGFSDFKEARIYLCEEVAVKYDWLDKSKKKKAKEFIKLVRRRYIRY